MILLGLETSHAEGSLCLQRNSQVLEFFNWKQEKSHAELLQGFLVKALKNHKLEQSDIDSYSVNIGPGSFTGIRISVNTIKTLSFVTHKPIYTFNSLETIAQSSSVDQNNLVVAINAHSDLCYVGEFSADNGAWKESQPITVIPSLKLNDILKKKNSLFVGDAFDVYKEKIDPSIKISRPQNYSDIPLASSLTQMAYLNKKNPISWEELEPFYLRLSSPEEKLTKST